MQAVGPLNMVRKYFGTDGIRGRANGVITAELALKVGQATGLVFRRGGAWIVERSRPAGKSSIFCLDLVDYDE